MIRKIASTFLVASAFVLFCTAVVAQDFPVLDQIADEGYPEVPACHLRTVVAGESTERKETAIANGTASLGNVEIRLADACGIYQQDSCAHS